MNASPSRRTFLGGVAAAGLAYSAMPAIGAPGANEAIRVGVIGTGGRARGLMKTLGSMPGVKIVAVSDVYDVALDMGRQLADPAALVTKAYREVLDRKDVDAVLIGTPDHWHAAMTVAACQAGKDVYVEKPLTHNIEEGAGVIQAQNAHARVVQVGTQQRSMPQFIKARELVRSGRLGKVFKVHMTWNRNLGGQVTRSASNIDPKQVDWKAFLGNAPDQPFDPYKVTGNWRWFWDFGGGVLTDLMVHWLDAAHWLLDLDHPDRATAFGTRQVASTTWETPDSVQSFLEYPGGLTASFEATFSNAHRGALMELMGTDATLYLDRGRFELVPERGKGAPESMVLGEGPRGRDFYDVPDGEQLHLAHWLDCIRTRAKPNAPAEAGVAAAAAAHLANRALRSGQVALWS